MAFRIHLLFICISLCPLLQYDANARKLESPEKSRSLGFSWGNCGPATDLIQIISLSIGPDPIRLPGNAVISISINITKPFPADVSAKVSMETKNFGIWVSVPCEHDVDSCSYSVCTNKTSIPPAIYSVSNLIETITKSIPSIVEGDFRMDINFDSSYAGHIGDLHVEANLKI